MDTWLVYESGKPNEGGNRARKAIYFGKLSPVWIAALCTSFALSAISISPSSNLHGLAWVRS
jgi:hypothetical protein